jgi:hypothetical protein
MVAYFRLALFIFLPALVGCATHADQLVKVRSFYQSGDLAAAQHLLDADLAKAKDDVDVLKLEKAMVDLAAGKSKEAEQTLREVRDRFDELDKPSVGETAWSMFSDDNRRSYTGEDYEKVLLRSMLALSNLMNGGDDAVAYAHQINAKQHEIVTAAGGTEGDDGKENLKLAYKQVALGPYIHGMLREETHVDYADAARAYQQVVYFEPDFRTGRWDLERVQNGHHSQRGHGALYVFALVGRGPYKTESLEVPSTAALLIADVILKSNNKYSLPTSVAPIKVPKVVAMPNEIDNVTVSIGGQIAGRTETITDVSRMAVEQYDAIFPQVVGRAVVRRLVKRGVVEGTKMVAGVDDGSALNLLFDAAEFAWGISEAADTRCWGLLPARIQVLRIELPAGEHTVNFAPAQGERTIGGLESATIQIADGQNTYVMVNFPDRKLVGKVLVSR